MAFGQVLPRRLARWAAAEPDGDQVYAEELPRVFNFFRYRFGRTADAEDLTARTFEKAIARIVAIDHARGTSAARAPRCRGAAKHALLDKPKGLSPRTTTWAPGRRPTGQPPRSSRHWPRERDDG